jgi:hypothetical protein
MVAGAYQLIIPFITIHLYRGSHDIYINQYIRDAANISQDDKYILKPKVYKKLCDADKRIYKAYIKVSKKCNNHKVNNHKGSNHKNTNRNITPKNNNRKR